MKKLIIASIIALTASGMFTARADSFGFYFGNDGFGMHFESTDYDYYGYNSDAFEQESSFDFFAALGPYGTWEYMGDFGGYVWIPAVPAGWRPYFYGSWTYTTYGWTWVAYEPWGWIPHHYGRWFYHPAYHWIWIPGYTWGPAYVTWGVSGGYYGWAPLPPDHCAYYNRYSYNRSTRNYYYYNENNYYNNNYYYGSSGQRSARWKSAPGTGAGSEQWIPESAWVFVGQDQFLAEDISKVALSHAKMKPYLLPTRFYRLKTPPSVHEVERYTKHHVKKIKPKEMIKYVNGHKIKVVRPTAALKQHRKAISRVRKSFKPVVKNNGKISTPQRNKVHSTNVPHRKPPITTNSGTITHNKHASDGIKQRKTSPSISHKTHKPRVTSPYIQPNHSRKPISKTKPAVKTKPNVKTKPLNSNKQTAVQKKKNINKKKPVAKKKPSSLNKGKVKGHATPGHPYTLKK